MKRLFPSALLPLDKTAVLPFVMTWILAAALVAQVFAKDPVSPAPRGSVLTHTHRIASLPNMPLADGEQAILDRSVFSPANTPGGGTSTAGEEDRDFIIVGVVQIGRAAFAVIHAPGGKIIQVPVGGEVSGWRLQSLTDTDAILARGTEKMTVPFGASVPLAHRAVRVEEQQ